MVISDEPELLRIMLADAAAQGGDLYRPGPYWRRKSQDAARQIARHGLADFRGATSTIGQSFSDAVILDVRHNLTGWLRGPFGFALGTIYPFNRTIGSLMASMTAPTLPSA